ncbi:hypothetical protein AB0N05_20090 [Nocardia sp. NPDC051030]|uniref:hypothetical protein n=1 Tax=Nocardia sp. NPDC051030 TaxID=3155162 RepID=UPI003434B5E9
MAQLVSPSAPIHARWRIPDQPRVRPIIALPWWPPFTAINATAGRHLRLFNVLFGLYAASYAGEALRLPDRELLVLRSSWNARGYVAWGHHVNGNLLLGRRRDAIAAITAGPDHPSWDPRRAGLLRAVDELYLTQEICRDTWSALDFTGPQRIEICALTGFYEAFAMTTSSIGLPFDGWSGKPLRIAPLQPSLPEPTLPATLLAVEPRESATMPSLPWWPLPWLPQSAPLWKTLDRHPRMAALLRLLRRTMIGHTKLPAADARLVTIRMLQLCAAHTEWVRDEFDALEASIDYPLGDPILCAAVDELHTSHRITDHTWALLRDRYTDAQLIELCVAAGTVRMVAMVANTLEAVD